MSFNYAKKTTSLVEVGAPGGGQAAFSAQSDTLTYEPFFGLNEKPFSLNADPRFIYDSPTYDAARKGLLAGIRRREGLLVLTGEIGTGKTTLCRDVLRDLGRTTYSSLIPDPFAAREDLLKMLLVDFGALSSKDVSAGKFRQASRTELGYLLSEFLDALGRDEFAVVVIDEAQNLSLPLIEETRILFDTFGAKGRLQIVFVGQPELHARLKAPEMRQVDQRVCGYHRLAPLSIEAVAGYVEHRLQVAGARRDHVLFPPAIIDALHRRSGGVPRLINRVCDRSLQVAYERKASTIDQEVLDTALIEIGSTTLSPTWDSILFSEGPVAPIAPAPTAAPAHTSRTAPADPKDDFQKEVEDWVEKDLAASSRKLTQLPVAPFEAAKPPRPVPAPKRQGTARPTTTGRPREARAETYMQNVWRVWAKRVAIAVAVFGVISVAILGGAILLNGQTPSVFAGAPAQTATEIAQTPPASTPASEAGTTAAPTSDAPLGASTVASTDYLIIVGLFADGERADQLVDALTEAGLPAMQRPFVSGQTEVQQVVLGPFLSRADAVADLRRLQAMGGHDDATIVDSTTESAAQ